MRLLKVSFMIKIEEYVDYLKTFDWFSLVGKDLPKGIYDGAVSRVSSWEEAVKWSKEQISFWCRIESGNLLMANIRANAPDRFAEWNNVARENLPTVQSLLNEYVLPRIPEPHREPATLFIQSQLVGVFIEVVFSDCSPIDLLRKQFRIYEKGFFPCGWNVESPEGFPNDSVVMVY
jgi:hypothetical protein